MTPVEAATSGREELRRGNERLNRFAIRFGALLAIIGGILPQGWQQSFGPIGSVIQSVAAQFPSIDKAAAVSPIPELVTGFCGIGALAVFAFCVVLAIDDPLELRFRFAFEYSSQSRLKVASFLYLVFLPMVGLCLWVAAVMPFPLFVERPITWGQHLVVSMVGSRLGLATSGSVAFVGFGLLMFMATVLVLGPLLSLLRRRYA